MLMIDRSTHTQTTSHLLSQPFFSLPIVNQIKSNQIKSNQIKSNQIKNQYAGPVNVSIVTKKIKIEHPNWKLPERRVNKFVKRYMSKEKNPAGADDDASVSTNQYKNEKKASSPSRSLFRMFSSRSKKNNLLSPPDDQLGSSLDTAPEAAPEPVRKEENAEEETPPVGEEVAEETYNPNEEEKLEKESKEEIEQITTEKDNIDKEIAYKTDLDKVDSSYDCCFASCSIM